MAHPVAVARASRAPGFEAYRAFDRDASDNREVLARNGKLNVPVLAVGGAISTSGPLVEEMMREVANDVTGVRVPRTAHWGRKQRGVTLRRVPRKRRVSASPGGCSSSRGARAD